MLEILLSTKSSQEFSPKMTFKESVLFCQCFKFIPALLTGLTCSCADLNINVTDNNWNKPLHAMMSRISEMNRCLGAVETLLNKGAATDIRNENGHLPIDLFRTISLGFDECVEERGERLLGGTVTNRCIQNEKQFLFFSICAFVLFYILVYMKTATHVCLQTESYGNLYIYPTVLITRYANFTQSIFMLILHRIFRAFNTSTSAFTSRGFKVKQTWSILYSEQFLLAFLENTSTAVFILRGLCSFFDVSFPTDIVFNVYCIFLCFQFFIIYFPTPCRNVFRKYHSTYILAVKISLVFFLVFWCLYLIIVYRQSPVEIIRTAVKHINSINTLTLVIFFFYVIVFLFYLSFKLILLYLYVMLLWFRLLKPLLYIQYYPVIWHQVDIFQIFLAFLLLFFIVDILSVPIIMAWCMF